MWEIRINRCLSEHSGNKNSERLVMFDRTGSEFRPKPRLKLIMKKPKITWLFLLALALQACDIIHKEDTVPANLPSTALTVFALPKNSVVMNLLTMEAYKNATSFRIARQPGAGTVSFIKDATLLYTPDTTASPGRDYFLLKVTTGDTTLAKAKTDTVIIKFSSLDSIPCSARVLPEKYITEPGKSISLPVLANDSFCQGSLDSTSLKIEVAPKSGTAGITGNRITYTPAAGFEGTDSFIYKVCSSLGTCGEAQVYVTVYKKDTNAYCPGPQADAFSVSNLNAAVLLNVLANDKFCKSVLDSSTLELVLPPIHGNADVSNNRLRYSPQPGFTGTDYLVYKICSKGRTECNNKVEVKILVKDPFCNILAADDTLICKINKGAQVDVLANDVLCSKTVTLVKFAGFKSGTFQQTDLASGKITYTPAQNFKGTDVSVYYISLQSGEVLKATLSVSVN